jgi:transposase
MRRVDPARLVVLDESGANLAMGRSHAWVRRGEEYVEPRPMNWGTNLTLVGAIRPTGWVALSTDWGGMTTERFTRWVRRRLVPRLRPGDIVLLDNLRAHLAPAVAAAVRGAGARLKFLPPYSPDFSPIEPAWGLTKKEIRAHAPRTSHALRRVAQRARHVVRPAHCHAWFVHAGYRQLK